MKHVEQLETKRNFVKLGSASSRAKKSVKDTESIIDKLATIIEKSHVIIEPYGTENF